MEIEKMREIKFQFLYRGQQYGNGNTDRPWFKKFYSLDELINRSLKELSDVHSFSELIAKRQYTGLKDKNGIEIYEGDIVIGWQYNPKGMYVVKFVSNKYNCQFIAEDTKGIGKIHIWHEDLRVIGNIHQNHDLLDK